MKWRRALRKELEDMTGGPGPLNKHKFNYVRGILGGGPNTSYTHNLVNSRGKHLGTSIIKPDADHGARLSTVLPGKYKGHHIPIDELLAEYHHNPKIKHLFKRFAKIRH